MAGAGCARLRPDVMRAPSGEPSSAVGIAAATGPCLDVTPDADEDGLSDACESALAEAFAPQLMFQGTRCTLPSAGTGDRLAGGYFHAAQPVRGAVRLVYLPAYYRDCGWSGFKCVFVDCSGHAGDSETIAVDVRRLETGEWAAESIFLSAHCEGDPDGDCRWYSGDDLEQFEWVNDIDRGAPVVWVSDGRHANYPTRAACERGHWWLDTCDAAAAPYRFPVSPERNIGSRARPLVNEGQPAGCVRGRFVEPDDPLIVDPESLECFWDASARFGGWQGARREAAAYGSYLDYLGL